MQIDWLTVAAQIVNFLVLVLLLRHFLYGPIVRNMNRREERIADRLDEAREKMETAEEKQRRLDEERRDLENRREKILSDAKEEAEKLRESLQEELREKMERKEHEWRRELAAERESFRGELRRLAGKSFQRLARRALQDLADAQLEEQMIRVFLDRLRDADQDTLRSFADASRKSGDKITVRSAFAIPSPLRSQITKLVHERVGDKIEVDYEEDASKPACGIELTAESRTLGWTIDGYLDRLERAIAEALPTARDEDGAEQHNAG